MNQKLYKIGHKMQYRKYPGLYEGLSTERIAITSAVSLFYAFP